MLRAAGAAAALGGAAVTVFAAAVFAAAAYGGTQPGGAEPLQPVGTPALPRVQPERLTVATAPPERIQVPDLVPGAEASPAPEVLHLPPVDDASLAWLDRLQTAVQDDPDFGSVAISRDRTTVTITWFGEPSATLREQMDTAPEKLRVVLQAAAFRPAELRELVLEAMRPGRMPGVQITSGGPENDGSGLRLGISELPDGRTPQDVGHQIAAALDRTDVPISVEVTGYVAAFTGQG